MSVQQLGTIYERTLEYGLEYENGAVVVSADDAARHESGSYYTPDSLVALIIDKAVGPFVEERLQAFRERAEALAKDKRRVEIRHAELQGLDPASLILDLKICDPAMGSGHFLVSLVDWLADRVLTAIAEAETLVDWSDTPYRSPVLNTIEATRQFSNDCQYSLELAQRSELGCPPAVRSRWCSPAASLGIIYFEPQA